MSEILRDPSGRIINYLRVSVIDRCNLRCVYCMPPEGVALKPAHEILEFEELERTIAVAVRLGIDRVRITGGEPLVRRDIVDLCQRLSGTGVADLSLTTNAVALGKLAGKLKTAGVQRVNISLDSLRPQRYREITGCDRFDDAYGGIWAAVEAGMHPVKINVVVIRGFNDDEIEDFAELARNHPVSVRFIELMPVGIAVPWSRRCRVGGKEVWDRLANWSGGRLTSADPEGNGPARVYRAEGAQGTVGLIAPVSEHICDRCNRLRLTSDGRLIPCLAGGEEFSVRDVIRSGGDDEAIADTFRAAVASKKPAGGFDAECTSGRMMATTGG